MASGKENAQTGHGHRETPIKHILGFILSLVLTFAALWVALYAPVSKPVMLTAILVLAVMQFFVQLLMFMHWTEGSGTYQVVTTLYGVFVAVVTVVGSVWIFLGMYGM